LLENRDVSTTVHKMRELRNRRTKTLAFDGAGKGAALDAGSGDIG
jgi:hypothetical protein